MAGLKYNININQLVLSTYPELDVVDGAILDYLHDIASSTNAKIATKRIMENDMVWTWVDYKTLLTRMPLLKIKSPGALTARLKKMETAGLISTRREIHQKLYITLTPEFDKLLINVNSSEEAIHLDEQSQARAIHLDEQSYSFRSTNDSIIDNTTIDASRSETVRNTTSNGDSDEAGGDSPQDLRKLIIGQETEEKPKVAWQDFFEHFKKVSGNRVIETDTRKAKFKTRLQTFTLEEMKQAVTNCFANDFYSGKNDRGWRAGIDYVLRNDEIVDRLLQLTGRQKKRIMLVET